VKKEYEEKQKRKREKEKNKSKGETQEANDKAISKDTKSEAIQPTAEGNEPSHGDAPKGFALHKDFYNMRLQKLRQQQAARRTRELLKTPTAFPTVPKGPIS